ncbi:mucin-2-like [Alosa sapidissima]|uniref:mucin-2-like n=1 Tax=Alosa sapidissima TaxID=34773 RepID=UPI001C08496E|nr:mucin-2-like [Alosa sapidissima]
MACLSGLTALLTLAILISSAQFGVTQDSKIMTTAKPTTAAPSASITPANTSIPDSQTTLARTTPTPPSTAAVGGPSAADSPPNSTNSSPADISSLPTRTPALQQNILTVDATSETVTSPPLTPTRQQNTTNPITGETGKS